MKSKPLRGTCHFCRRIRLSEKLPQTTADYSGFMVFVLRNGRIAKVPHPFYQAKINRKKLITAYCNTFSLHTVFFIKEDIELLLKSTNGRILAVSTVAIFAKITKDNNGIAVVTRKKGKRLSDVTGYEKGALEGDHRYRAQTLPADGGKKPVGTAEQKK